MELRHLRYFQTVARAGSISAASAQLHIVQPALSRQMHDLEEELGFALFERQARGVALTRGGEQFLTDVDRLLLELQNASSRALAVATGRSGNLTVSFIGTATHLPFMREGIRQLQSRGAQISLKLVRLRSEQALQALREHRIDVALCYHRPQGERFFDHLAVRREGYLLAMPSNHRLAAAKLVRLTQVADEPILWFPRSLDARAYDELAVAFAIRKLKFQVAQEGDGEEVLLELVSLGMGVTFVTESVTTRRQLGNVVLRRVKDLDIELRLDLVWRRGDRSALANAFVDILRPLISSPTASP
jgi:DNA-binding transcriptional LysR family regulator